jgi:hypothetical protein
VSSIYSLIIVPSLPPSGPLLIVLVLGPDGASRVDSFIAHCPVVRIRDAKGRFLDAVVFLSRSWALVFLLLSPSLSLGNWYSKLVSGFEIFVTSTMWI